MTQVHLEAVLQGALLLLGQLGPLHQGRLPLQGVHGHRLPNRVVYHRLTLLGVERSHGGGGLGGLVQRHFTLVTIASQVGAVVTELSEDADVRHLGGFPEVVRAIVFLRVVPLLVLRGQDVAFMVEIVELLFRLGSPGDVLEEVIIVVQERESLIFLLLDI